MVNQLPDGHPAQQQAEEYTRVDEAAYGARRLAVFIFYAARPGIDPGRGHALPKQVHPATGAVDLKLSRVAIASCARATFGAAPSSLLPSGNCCT